MINIGAEDWGWMVELENEEFPLWIGCGHQNGDNDEFSCFIEPSKPFIRKWFKKIDTTVQVGRVSEALRKVLQSNPDILAKQGVSDAATGRSVRIVFLLLSPVSPPEVHVRYLSVISRLSHQPLLRQDLLAAANAGIPGRVLREHVASLEFHAAAANGGKTR